MDIHKGQMVSFQAAGGPVFRNYKMIYEFLETQRSAKNNPKELNVHLSTKIKNAWRGSSQKPTEPC